MLAFRAGAGALLAAVAVLLLASPAGARPSRSSDCAPRAADVQAADRSAVVFVVDRDDEHTLYGCAGPRWKRRTLTTWFDCGCSRGDQPTPRAWVAGMVAAVSQFVCDPTAEFACTGRTRSISLTSGRRLRSISTPGEVTGLVLRSDGVFALVRGSSIVAATRTGEAVLDSGVGIDARTLALSVSGDTVYWTRAGVPRSARLP